MNELVGLVNLPPHVKPVAQNLQHILKAGFHPVKARLHPGISHPGEEIEIGFIYLSSNIVKLCTRPTTRHTDRQLVAILRESWVPGKFVENRNWQCGGTFSAPFSPSLSHTLPSPLLLLSSQPQSNLLHFSFKI